jgi:hypothetical protein
LTSKLDSLNMVGDFFSAKSGRVPSDPVARLANDDVHPGVLDMVKFLSLAERRRRLD